ncbi:hypothetical protein [Streptomyces sp. NPDC048606]|uniref:hypothetical protein n=1 Tax=Streptomyces sp. NPDC048606 TaxID=3154726 RepID=UPI003430484F
MSHEVAPETPRQTGHTGQAAHEQAHRESAVPAQGSAPKGLLQQMEELMAALNADLSRLDADLNTADRAPAAAPTTAAGHVSGSDRGTHSDRGF